MKLTDFDFHLPPGSIAQYPAKDRASCKLLVLDRATGQIEHRMFSDLPSYLSPKDALILNDTKVLNCRLFGKRHTGGKVEVFLLNRKDGLTFEAMVRPGRVKIGETISFDGGISAQVCGRNEVRFDAADAEEVYRIGTVPLPPYIKRKAEEMDREYYQTVYARAAGSVASPTAGLHFTPQLLSSIERSGTAVGFVTLHVGQATFAPVKSEDIENHRMGREWYHIPEGTRSIISQPRRICAVGTTSCRTIESFAATGRAEGWTQLFIYPGYKFARVTALLTNFHLPRTTLFMLVCAFAGKEPATAAYEEAVKRGYRFYSYGDAMLII